MKLQIVVFPLRKQGWVRRLVALHVHMCAP